MPSIKYKSTNDDLDEKSKFKRLGVMSLQGKVLASLHNVLPAIFGSIADDPLVPIPNFKTSGVVVEGWNREDQCNPSV